MTKEIAEKIVRGITDKIESCTADIDDWAEFWGFTREEYEEFLDMTIKALEKDIAKEPVQTHKRYGHGNEYDDYYCPECDEFLAYEPQGNRYKSEGGWSRCRNCGQKIIWKDKK